MQDASRHTPLEHPGQAASAMAPHANRVHISDFGAVQDRFYDEAVGRTSARLLSYILSGRRPNILVPIRTMLAPSSMATR